MKNYNNTILLKQDDKVDAIIFTNEETEIINKAIKRAYDKWQEQGTFPESQLEFTLEYLNDIYDIKYLLGDFDEISY